MGEGVADSRKFYVLDALRGIAALTVVQLHTARFFGDVRPFRHAGLAVDFFFMLSGFVLTYAYQAKLDSGWPTASFMKTRLIRLYPLYLLGCLIGAAFWILRAHFGHSQIQASTLALLLLLGLFILPAPPAVHAAGGAAFPFNLPTWSLFFEVLANLFHGSLLRRKSQRLLQILAGLSAIALIATVSHLDTIDCGPGQVDVYFGVTRILFAYTAGILVFFMWTKHRLRVAVSPFIPALLLIAILVGPSATAVWFDLVSMILLFPILVFLGACSTPSNSLLPVTHWMGITSYAIYILHAPLSAFFELGWNRAFHHNIDLDAPWGGLAFMVFIVLAAVAIDRWYDTKLLSFLRAKLS